MLRLLAFVALIALAGCAQPNLPPPTNTEISGSAACPAHGTILPGLPGIKTTPAFIGEWVVWSSTVSWTPERAIHYAYSTQTGELQTLRDNQNSTPGLEMTPPYAIWDELVPDSNLTRIMVRNVLTGEDDDRGTDYGWVIPIGASDDLTLYRRVANHRVDLRLRDSSGQTMTVASMPDTHTADFYALQADKVYWVRDNRTTGMDILHVYDPQTGKTEAAFSAKTIIEPDLWRDLFVYGHHPPDSRHTVRDIRLLNLTTGEIIEVTNERGPMNDRPDIWGDWVSYSRDIRSKEYKLFNVKSRTTHTVWANFTNGPSGVGPNHVAFQDFAGNPWQEVVRLHCLPNA